MSQMKTNEAVAALAALAQETRLELFRLLVTTGPEGIAAGEISRRLSVPNATLSFHLKELKTAGLIACRRQSRSLIYTADFKAMGGLINFLLQDCCQGSVDVACELAGLELAES